MPKRHLERLNLREVMAAVLSIWRASADKKVAHCLEASLTHQDGCIQAWPALGTEHLCTFIHAF